MTNDDIGKAVLAAQIVVIVDDGPLVRAWAERLLRPRTHENAAREPPSHVIGGASIRLSLIYPKERVTLPADRVNVVRGAADTCQRYNGGDCQDGMSQRYCCRSWGSSSAGRGTWCL
jgi:hypothetical protein